MQHDILNTEVTTIDGEKTTLAAYAGKVLLIVNGFNALDSTLIRGQMSLDVTALRLPTAT
jgi:hypothetical protein